MVHFETMLDGGQILEIQSSINITCYQDSFIVRKEYSSTEAVEKIEKRLMIFKTRLIWVETLLLALDDSQVLHVNI